MKATLPLLASILVLGACVPAAKAPPAPAPVARPAPVPTPTPTPAPAPVIQAPVSDNWMDAPATPGDWRYAATANGSQADFGTPAAPVAFTIACRATTAGPQIELTRHDSAADNVPFTVRTETATRTFRARTSSQRTILVYGIDPRDPLLDAIALSKGRFAIEVEGLPTLYLPSWAEVTRVIEDCR
ncbi:hypothetical protein OIK40_08445 [Erythrobacter sp. sf7]|uniref:Lipoprotein n=1 Tax=Erythrobacter fulvus TaxID=2987523 RepID=A0ABT5JPG7_9SPHN|nr:hypothetical protein [Erythrobacter fulvus]MDC8754667.1 hypothetical protein [Erythrobacter fulvus]